MMIKSSLIDYLIIFLVLIVVAFVWNGLFHRVKIIEEQANVKKQIETEIRPPGVMILKKMTESDATATIPYEGE